VHYEDDGAGVWKDMGYPGGGHSGYSEVGAYETARFLGMDEDLVPTTVFSELDGVQGTSQEFIQGATIGFDARLEANNQAREIIKKEMDAGKPFRPSREVESEVLVKQAGGLERIEQMALLDTVIGNTDRHGANFIFAGGKLYAIDHGHTDWRNDSGNIYGRFRMAFDKLNLTGFGGRWDNTGRDAKVIVSPKTRTLIQSWKSLKFNDFIMALAPVIGGASRVDVSNAWDNMQALIKEFG